MKLHILNDLHIEFDDFEPAETQADVVVLAGDIGVGLDTLDWIERRFPEKPVIYVPGNHEYYHHDLSLLRAFRRKAQAQVHVLDNEAVELQGVRFLGSTLWTDFLLFGEARKYPAMQLARSVMTDFQVIGFDGVQFTPEAAVRLHQRSCLWLAHKLGQRFDGSTVVVTHHAPSPRSVHPRYAAKLLTPAFVSDLEGLMGANRVGLWVHGHTHEAFDYDVRGTRIVCNPRGYAPDQLSDGFKPDLVVEI